MRDGIKDKNKEWRTWKTPTRGEEGTSPKMWIETVEIAIDKGLKLGLTQCKHTKFTGPCIQNLQNVKIYSEIIYIYIWKHLRQKKFTWVAKTSSSPIEKRAMKTYRFLKQKAAKQNIAPKKVAAERSCKKKDTISTSEHYFYGNMTGTAVQHYK